MTSTTDRIEKKLLLRAPQERVWSAISDITQFCYWFGMELDGKFTPGAQLKGRWTSTKVDPEVGEMHCKHVGKPFVLVIDRIEPQRVFSYQWHPYSLDPNYDYSKEPMTTVTFTLEPAEGGTMLTVVESGFDSIPLERRAEAFEAHGEGWVKIMQIIEKYVSQK